MRSNLGQSLYKLGEVVVKYYDAYGEVVATVGQDENIDNISPEALQKSNEIRKIAEEILLEYAFSISDLTFNSLSAQDQQDANKAATMALMRASFTYPEDIDNYAKKQKLNYEDAKILTFGHMALKFFKEEYPLDTDDNIWAEEIVNYSDNNTH